MGTQQTIIKWNFRSFFLLCWPIQWRVSFWSFQNCYAIDHYVERRCVECQFAKYTYSECRNSDCYEASLVCVWCFFYFFDKLSKRTTVLIPLPFSLWSLYPFDEQPSFTSIMSIIFGHSMIHLTMDSQTRSLRFNDNTFGGLTYFLSGIQPMYMVDSSTFYVSGSIFGESIFLCNWVFQMKLTHLSPVQYWFIISKSKVFIHRSRCKAALIKMVDN